MPHATGTLQGLRPPLPCGRRAFCRRRSRPFLKPESAGKIDLIDMEQWTLTRTTFAGTAMTTKTVGLNHVLDYSGH